MTTLIPRHILLGNPDHATPQISPDGAWLAWIAPDEGVLNVWVAPTADLGAARVVTRDRVRGVRSYDWAYDGTHILYVQDAGGDENWHVRAARLDGSEDRDLTPVDGIQARMIGTSPHHPHEILVGLNDRVPELHDVWRIDLRSGERVLEVENPGFLGFLADQDLRVRVGVTANADGGMVVYTFYADEDWRLLFEIPQEDSLTTSPIAIDGTGTLLFLVDSRGRDTAAAWALNLQSGEQVLLAEDPRADVSDMLIHPRERRVQAVASTWDRKRWQVLDPALKPDLDALEALANGGQVEVLARDEADRTWTVAIVGDDGPVRYYLWSRENQQATFLFTNRAALADYTLARMRAVVIPARDGLPLVSYLSLPAGADSARPGLPDAPLPLVLDVHGGPWARDEWGYNAWHQLLANRGYAVLSVNFRGSTGFGKAFTNAGDRQWAGAMHQDLLDAVAWAVTAGIADPAKVAIMGGSYGGYATLVGLTFTPDVFVCGVDIVGPSNLETLLSSIPPYWKPLISQFYTRVGDPTTPEGLALLQDRSPLHRADQIVRPLLIAQGANDPRVKQAESDQIVHAMKRHGIPVTYVVFPDEGHGFARPENNLAFAALCEAFLAEHLGGRAEEVGDTLAASTAELR
jgi:dipeptidyl aminopeptidase/acylaminoacyl peptidase